MGLGSGMFNIIRQGQNSAALAANLSGSRPASTTSSTASGGSNPQSWTLKRNESAVDALWRLAPEQASRAKMLTPSTMQKLQKLAESDNKDISAEKMRQAKAKLEGLRRQLQMLAATGDVRQLRRIAAEAASLAREIGAAARAMATGIGSGQAPSPGDGGAQAVANAANGAAQSAPDASAQESARAPVEAQGDTQASDTETQNTTASETAKSGSALGQSFKELKELSDDARNAIVQAKGIIALAAQMARARRKAAEDDDDRYFRDLQEQADAALSEVDRGQREATSMLIAESGAASAQSITGGITGGITGSSTESTVETTTIVTSVTIETSITAMVLTQPQVDVFA